MLRLLLVADTHLGFDLPQRPRSARVRRGEDFFAGFARALAPALEGEVDLVVHGGDLLYRSRVPRGLVARALEPLLEVADRGVPVVLVPGNHERSSLPFPLLAAHPRLHLLDRPRTVHLTVAGSRVALSGFPCERERVGERFPALLAACGPPGDADVRLLCLHQTVEGATVGPRGYTFRRGPDVIPGRAIPAGFAAVLCGHIHRAQVLNLDLAGGALAAPVVYPGSVERTSLAERDEAKGFVTLELAADRERGGRLVGCRFHPLPTRPMRLLPLDGRGLDRDELARRLAVLLATQPANAVVHLDLRGPLLAGAEAALRAAPLARLTPPGMVVTVRLETAPSSGVARAVRPRERRADAAGERSTRPDPRRRRRLPHPRPRARIGSRWLGTRSGPRGRRLGSAPPA